MLAFSETREPAFPEGKITQVGLRQSKIKVKVSWERDCPVPGCGRSIRWELLAKGLGYQPWHGEEQKDTKAFWEG